MKNPFRTPTREELLLTTLERLEKEKLQALSIILEADSSLDLIRRKLQSFQHELNILQGKTVGPFTKEELEPPKFPDIPH